MKKFKLGVLIALVIFGAFTLVDIVILTGAGASVEVTYAGENGCSKEYPIAVEVKNRMPFSINSYSFSISAKREGYSSDVRNDFDQKISDKIIPAFGSQALCWPAPEVKSIDKLLMNDAEKIKSHNVEMKENESLLWTGKLRTVSWEHDFQYHNSAY